MNRSYAKEDLSRITITLKPHVLEERDDDIEAVAAGIGKIAGLGVEGAELGKRGARDTHTFRGFLEALQYYRIVSNEKRARGGEAEIEIVISFNYFVPAEMNEMIKEVRLMRCLTVSLAV